MEVKDVNNRTQYSECFVPKQLHKNVGDYYNINYIKTINVGINAKVDISILKHIRVRELFRKYEKKEVKIPYCGIPDFQILNEFFFKNNINCSVDGLKKAFINNTLIFEENNVLAT